MSKPEWFVTGEDDNHFPLGMSVYLNDSSSSPFIGILHMNSGWNAFLSLPYKGAIRVELDLPKDVSDDSIMEAWELAKRKAVEALSEKVEFEKQKAIQEADEMIHQIKNCI